ncbi:GntR family transcriptional regulator [Streptomyces sp. NBC_01794]|uniref:GntR family transcriptional regulator n=1 Tax=Streptomyces sp. NBC_01794 TaxID=2975942 RepID=UPI00308A1910|nr:GntR family transcriptional regulator [Streptomyces sp. NBC_01794]
MTDALAPERTALYRLYGTEDDLLYVGISNDPDGRWKAHQWGPNRMPWSAEVSRRTVDWHASRPAALAAEAIAIRAEHPRYNGTHNYDDVEFDPASWAPVAGQLKHALVADLMRREIVSGRWANGGRVPSLRILGKAAGVSMRTVSKASVLLQGEGLLAFESGRGLFVSRPEAVPPKTYAKLPHDWCWSLAG